MTLLILDLKLEQNPLKTIAYVTNMQQQNRNKYIYMRARAWRPHQPSQLLAAPGALIRAHQFPAIASFSRLFLTISTFPFKRWWCQLPTNHHAALSPTLFSPHPLQTQLRFVLSKNFLPLNLTLKF
jgi:hypothetical protein